MPEPSATELLHHHLKYEFDMLQATYARIRHSDPIINNALIESFCIHARGLIEFFKKDRGAKAYADSEYVPFSGCNTTRRDALNQKLNNQIAHLLYGRTANPAEQINRADQAELKTLLEDELARFKVHLLPIYASQSATTAYVVQMDASPPSTTNAIDSIDARTVSPNGNGIWRTNS